MAFKKAEFKVYYTRPNSFILVWSIHEPITVIFTRY